MRFLACLLLALARAFPHAASALAHKLPVLFRLAVLLTLGAGGYALYDGYDAIRDRAEERAGEAAEWAGHVGNAVAGWGERRVEWATEHPEQASLWGATLLGMGVLYRSHRKAGRTRAESAAAGFARLPVVEDPNRPLTAREKALNRAAVKELTDEHDALNKRVKALPGEIAQAEKNLKALADEATRARALADLKERNAREAAQALEARREELDRTTAQLAELETEFDRLERLT